jgi:hypothetical protein
MKLTISLSDEELKILKKRSKENLLTIKEMVEDIVRRSCINAKLGSSCSSTAVDDRLVEVFSRVKRKK